MKTNNTLLKLVNTNLACRRCVRRRQQHIIIRVRRPLNPIKLLAVVYNIHTNFVSLILFGIKYYIGNTIHEKCV